MGKSVQTQTLLAPRDPKDTEKPLVLLPHQATFALSSSKNTYLAGGWGSAKSVALAAFCYISSVQNWGLSGIVVLPTHRMHQEFVHSMLRPMLKDMEQSYSASDGILHLTNGGRIVCLSGHRIERIEQYNAAWAAADEAGLMSRDLYVRLAARVRDERAVNRRIGYAGTPIWGWLKDEFDGRDDEQRRIIHASTRDNPYLPDDFIDNLVASCPARLAKAYIEGYFVPPGGTVYAEFDPDVHVIPWAYRPDLPTIASIDWSPRVPHIIICQMLPEGITVGGRKLKKLTNGHEYAGMVVCDEIVLDGSRVAITRETLLTKLIEKNYRLDHFVCDPAGGAVQSSTTVTDIRRAVEMLGVSPRLPRGPFRSIQAGVAHVQNLFAPMDKLPRLFLAKDMVDRANTLAQHVKGRASINALFAYGYPEDDTSPVPVKDGISDHFCDCLRYATVVHFAADRLLNTTVKQAA